MRIREGREGDLPRLLEIYNYYVAETHITFDVEQGDLDSRLEWFDRFSSAGPHRLFVVEEGESVCGYASSGLFRQKPAYARSVETSIYLAPERAGGGLGSALYGHLLDVLAAEPSVHRAYGGVAIPNPASLALHEKLGFLCVGTFREVGFKFGSYWDVAWFERAL
jgi:phosphinothricin acetyltransferase